MPHLDLLIADFKVFDESDHVAWTGVSNDRIRQNFEYVVGYLKDLRENKDRPLENQATGPALLVRIPMIPDHTATANNLRQIGQFFYRLDPALRIELLNYNPLAMNKYALLEQSYLFDKNPKMFTPADMDAFVAILKETGIDAFVEPAR